MFMWWVLPSPWPMRGVPVRVVDDEVGVGAGRDDALLAVQAEHPRRRGRGQLDPALEGDLPGDHALVHQVHPVLDRADAVGDRPEVALAELLLVLHAERAVVGGDHLQVVGAQRLPHVVLVALGRGRAAGSSRPTSHPRRRRTRRCSRRAAPRARGRGTAGRSRRRRSGPLSRAQASCSTACLARHVHDVQRSAGEVGEHDRAVGRLLLHLPGAGDAVVVRVGLALARRAARRARRWPAPFSACIIVMQTEVGGLLHRAQDLARRRCRTRPGRP